MARRRLTPAPQGGPALSPRPAANTPPIAQMAGQSAEAAALRTLSAQMAAAREDGRMVIEVPLAAVVDDHLLRDRLGHDPEALAALQASIAAHGQRVPAEVTPLEPGPDGEPRYGLISGWRRLQALRALHGDSEAGRLRALLRPAETATEAYTAMVEENELRVGLSYYERARLVAESARAGIFADQTEALRTLFATASRAKRSKIASFIDIHEQLGDLLQHPTEIPERLGLALVARLRGGGRTALRAALHDRAPADAASELALLQSLTTPAQAGAAKPSPAGNVSRAKQQGTKLAPGLSVQTRRKGQRLTVVLEGPAVDGALEDRLQRLLRDLA